MMKLCAREKSDVSRRSKPFAEQEEAGSACLNFLDLQRDQGENPEFDIECRLQESFDCEGLWNCIVSVLVDSSNNKVALVRVKESPGLIGFVWEIDEKEVGKE